MGPRQSWKRGLGVVVVGALLLSLGLTTLGGAMPSNAKPGTHAVVAASSSVSLAASARRPDLAYGVVTIAPSSPVTRNLYDAHSNRFLLNTVPSLGQNTNGSVRAFSDASYRVVTRYFFWQNMSPRMDIDTSNGTVLLSNVTGQVLFLDNTSLTVLGQVSAPPRITNLLYDPVDDDIYVVDSCDPGNLRFNASVTVISASSGTTIATIPFPCSPTALAVDTTNGNVFVRAGRGGNLTTISGANQSILATIPGLAPGIAGPDGLTYDPGTGELFARCTNSTSAGCLATINGSTGALDQMRLLDTVIQGSVVVDRRGLVDYLAWQNVSGLPDENLFTLTPANGSIREAAVAPCYEDALGSNPVSGDLFAVAHCGALGRLGGVALYTTAPYALEAVVIASNSSYETYPVTGDTAAVSPRSGDVEATFLAAGGGSDAFLIGPFPATFQPVVYAPGVVWSITLGYANGFTESFSTTDATVTLWIPNGSYSYTWGVPLGYYQSAPGGTFVMAGAPVHEAVTLSWSWWAWTGLALGVVGILLGVRAGRRTRFDFHVRRAEARAKLEYDLAHPLTGPPKQGEPPPGPPY